MSQTATESATTAEGLTLDARHATPSEVAKCFWRNGIVVLKHFLGEEQSRALREELADVVATEPDKPWGGGEDYARRFEVRVQVWHREDQPRSAAAMNDPRLDEYTAAICGGDYQKGGVGIFSTPRTGTQSWHQDSSSQGAGHYEINRIVFPAATKLEQGALYVVPGTHQGGDLPAGGNHEPLPGEVKVLPRAGSLVLMHTRCYHRVGENRSDERRTQVNSRVRPAGADESLCNRAVFRTGFWDFQNSTFSPRENGSAN